MGQLDTGLLFALIIFIKKFKQSETSKKFADKLKTSTNSPLCIYRMGECKFGRSGENYPGRTEINGALVLFQFYYNYTHIARNV